MFIWHGDSNSASLQELFESSVEIRSPVEVTLLRTDTLLLVDKEFSVILAWPQSHPNGRRSPKRGVRNSLLPHQITSWVFPHVPESWLTQPSTSDERV